MKKPKDEVGEQFLDLLTDVTNRSVNQTKMLFDVLGKVTLVLELENAMRFFGVFYCPGDMAECYYLIGKYRTWKAMGWTTGFDEMFGKLVK